jgi:hypothetical protein
MKCLVLGTALTLVFVAPSYRAISVTRCGDERTADAVELAAQVRDLQKQLAESCRIVAAGTATWRLGKAQNNSTSVRVQLKDEEIASRLGEDYIVLLTNRYSGYPFYVPYWKKAGDGFDITLVDPTLAPEGSVSDIFNVNRTFLVDWIVVKK